MKARYIPILLFLLCSNSFAEENTLLNQLSETNSLSYALTQGTFKGLLRYSGQYRDSNLHTLQDSTSSDTSNEKKQQYSAIGGYFGYETAPFFYTSLGTTLYTSQPAGNNPDNRRGLGGLYENNGKQESYTVFGEAYIKFEHEDHLIKIGRQEMPDYRFVSLSNVRMSPITHEGAVYENTVFNHFKFNLAYITKIKERNAEKFIDMAKAARLKESSNGKALIHGQYDTSDYDSSGYIGDKKEMSMAGLLYNTDTFLIEGWNYHINDFVNTLYFYGQYNFTPDNSDAALTLSAQYAKQSDIGDHIAGNIDTWFYGLKFQAVTQGITFFVSYNEVDYNENSYDGGSIFVRWGSPQMFNSFQVQDSELAGTKSYGTGLQYQFDHNSIFPGVVMRLRYADYDLPDDLSQTDARQDRTETTFDINYSFTKTSSPGRLSLDGLSIQFRLAYNDYNTDYNFNAYKKIHGYSFDSVTEDFIDVRLYIDYKF